MQKVLEVAIILSAVDRMSRVVNAATNNVISRLESVQKKSDAVAKGAFQMGRDFGAAGVAMGGGLGYLTKQAADFETGMANVRKVVDGLNDTAELEKMGKQIRELSRELPMPINQIQDLVAAGGRMGIPREQLVQYTKDVAKMSIAFDMLPGEIGEQMGKLATVYGIPIPKIGELGDAINFLDDNAIAKGADIIDVMRRVGGTAQQVGLGARNVAALASTFLTLGSSAEVSATASNALIRELSIAKLQPERFQKGLAEIGLKAAELQKNMMMDPQNTILGVLDKINSLPKEKQISVTTQLFGKEYGDDIAKLSGGIKEYRRQLELLNDPKLNGSMQREFAIRQATANAQMQIFRNNIQEVAIVAGTALLPIFNSIIQSIKPYVIGLTTWIENNKELSTTIAKIAVGMTGFSLAMSAGAFMVGGIAKAVSMFMPILKFLTTGIGWVIKAFGVLRIVVLTNPILAIISAIAVGAYLIYANWDKIGPWFAALWDKVKSIFNNTWEWLKAWFATNSLVRLLLNVWGDFSAVFTAFYNAGANIMEMIWQGIKSMANKPVEAIKETVAKMREYLPFSPAKVGPFRDLHRVKIVETIAQAVKPAPLVKAMRGVAQAAADTFAPGGPTLSPVAATTGGVTVNFQPNINWSGAVTESSKTDLLAMLKEYEGDLMRLIDNAIQKRQRARF